MCSRSGIANRPEPPHLRVRTLNRHNLPRPTAAIRLPLRAHAVLLAALLLSGLLPLVAAPVASAIEPAQRAEIRGDLAGLVAGTATPDPRIGGLIPGLKAGELAYFVVLDVKNDAGRAATLQSLGARILRTYRTVNAFAVVSPPVTVLRIADLSWTDWLAPIEIVTALDEPVADQTRATTADVGAPPWWAQGVTGTGVRIAVLDTGLDQSHQDLDDLDFGHWSEPVNAPKVVDQRSFLGGGCTPSSGDFHGHGTHVSGIATGTGEGIPGTALDPSDAPSRLDNGRYAGIAPGAQLAMGKVLTDAGAGLNSDLIAALEWAAMPAEPLVTGCAIGADVVNLSLGSDVRPMRLNSGRDGDLVSVTLDRLAVRYGTIFVAAIGNSGPYIGSGLESPGSAYQVISVAAAAKDYDLNHDDTLSGDTCSGYMHPPSPAPANNDCRNGVGNQPPSIASFSSRGPGGDQWLRPDIAAPGYNIVAPQAATGVLLAQNDANIGTRDDPLYATASGTSMATPATTGSAALVLDAYRRANGGADPSGASGINGLRAGPATLVRAALMNSAGNDMLESRWILTTDARTSITCPTDADEIMFGFCSLGASVVNSFLDIIGSNTAYEVRNGAADPYVGPLAEGAGKLNIGRAIAALRGGVVIYSAASGSGVDAGTGPREFQGSWQIGAAKAGSSVSQKFVLHNAPRAPATTVRFAFSAGHPSDGSKAIPASGAGAWTITLPGSTNVTGGGSSGTDKVVELKARIPAGTAPGVYTGTVLATLTNGTVLHLPVFAIVALHDSDPAAGNAAGAQGAYTSARDVFAKDDTVWPNAAGAALGSTADWLVFPVELASNLSSASFRVWDTDAGNETYDLYVYDANLDLVASSHPLTGDGATIVPLQAARTASTEASPTLVTLTAPPAGRHYLAVSRARIGRGPIDPIGDFGSFRVTLDEVGAGGTPAPSFLAYSGDFTFVAGQPGRLAATLTDEAGGPIRGRLVTFTFGDGSVSLCGGACQALTDVDGVAQLAVDAAPLATGVHEVHARFAGDPAVSPSGADAFVIVFGPGGLPPPPVGGGSVAGGGWFVPDGATAGPGDLGRIHVALHARTALPAPTGQLRWRDRQLGIDLTLESWTALLVVGDTATLRGRARTATGAPVDIEVTIRDVGEPGSGQDTIRLRYLDNSYDRSGTLGGGNFQVASG
jgi:subtilisin family serine protease